MGHRSECCGSLLPVLSSSQVFSFTNPGGKYTLDLAIPYDRSLCRPVWVAGLGHWQTSQSFPKVVREYHRICFWWNIVHFASIPQLRKHIHWCENWLSQSMPKDVRYLRFPHHRHHVILSLTGCFMRLQNASTCKIPKPLWTSAIATHHTSILFEPLLRLIWARSRLAGTCRGIEANAKCITRWQDEHVAEENKTRSHHFHGFGPLRCCGRYSCRDIL